LKFTKTKVDALTLPAGATDFAFYDENMPGFGIRFRAGGTVGTFFVQYAIGKKHRRIQLGKNGVVTLASAQAEAQQIRAQVARKIDPANERGRATVDANLTFDTTRIDAFLAQLESDGRSKSYVGQNRMYLNTHFKALHGMALTAIDKETVGTQLKDINKRGKVTMNRARASLSAFFNWAVKEYNGVTTNPAEMTNKNDEKPRNRILEISSDCSC
jgi:hypothetical protein